MSIATNRSERPGSGQRPGLAPAWGELLIAARERPWLQAALRRGGGRMVGRFALAYRRLLALPGRVRARWLARLGLSLAGAALLLALGGLPVGSAPANTITVGGACTLIDAITAANTDTATGGCDAGSGADVLDLQADVTLTAVDNTTYGATGLPVITTDITIQGNGHTISRSTDGGTPNFRIFALSGSGASLTLESATVNNGRTQTGGSFEERGGGGILARSGSVVSVAGGALFANSASYHGGGIYARASSTVSVANSTLSANSAPIGGGIYSGSGTRVSVANSTLSANSAGTWGGGMFAFRSTVSVANSTLSANSAGRGGGMHARESTVSVANSTLSANSAGTWGGGMYARYGTVSVANSTLSANSAGTLGGGMFAFSSTVRVANSIVALQTAGSDCAGASFVSGGHNIESATSCGFTGTDDQQNVNNTALKLLPLANNGGPTQTHALSHDSVAIDAANNAICAAAPISNRDQRGFGRPFDGNGDATPVCDVGAFEFQALNLRGVITIPGVQATLTWDDLQASKYQVWRSLSPYDGFALLADDLTSTSHAVNMDSAANYYYEVRAFGAFGGDPLVSARIGVFTFGIVPGSS